MPRVLLNPKEQDFLFTIFGSKIVFTDNALPLLKKKKQLKHSEVKTIHNCSLFVFNILMLPPLHVHFQYFTYLK